jgi:hypothetical protein
MFEVWNRTAGLGDAYSDCLATVASAGSDHVWTGQSVTVSGIMGAGLYLQGNFAQQVQTALNAAGFSQVSVSAPGLLGSGGWSVTVVAPSDFNSILDVQSIVASAVESAGGPTGPMSSTKSQITPDQICATWKGGSAPVPGGTPTGTGAASAGGGGISSLTNLLGGAGIGIGGVLAVIAVLFLAKAIK